MDLNKLSKSYRLQEPEPYTNPATPIIKSNWDTLHYLRLTGSICLRFVIFYREYSKIWSKPNENNNLTKIVIDEKLPNDLLPIESLAANPSRWWAIHHWLRVYKRNKRWQNQEKSA